jgi:peroxiredoxin
MKKATLTMLLLLVLAAGPAIAAAVGSVGSMAPAFSLKDLNGKTHSLADYKGKVVVLEWVNPLCPFSDRHAREKTMSNLAKKHGGTGGVVWLGINSTNANHDNFLQPAEHQAWSKKNGVNYAVLYDETGKVGKAYDAKTTPHMFIVDEQGKIAYNGAIDDDPSGRTAAAQRLNYVDGGLIAELAGKKADPAATKPYGCSVKY